jgi:broad specificity phosphatase PhoE
LLLLARHGEAGANAAGILLGRSDSPLTERGKAQALRIAEALAGSDPVAIVSSPLTRALETANIIRHEFRESRGRDVPIKIDERWIEIDYGNLEGIPLARIPQRIWSRWMRDPNFAPISGESLAQVTERVKAAVADVAGPASRADVLVVSHVTPIKVAACLALGADVSCTFRMHLRTGSITRIRPGRAASVLVSFGETGHLREAGEADL